MTDRKIELLGLNTAELADLCQRLGYSAFRGRQISQWLYRHSVESIDAMTNLPRNMREALSQSCKLTRSRVLKQSRSGDGTTKFLLGLDDGETVEAVFLPYSDRVSVCVSSQIGCPIGCLFCATAKSGFVRNLRAGEIVDQVITLQSHGTSRVTNVVFMGMGEPLLNFENVVKAVRLLNAEVGIGMRRIAISTAGITPMIRKLMEMELQLTLAVSLHATHDELRRRLIPASAKYPLDDLISCCREYAEHTRRRITFEYLLLQGVNDSSEEAARLARLLRGMLCNVNLIPYNEVAGSGFRRPSPRSIRSFRQTLERSGVQVTQRLERGHSSEAACGQLRRRTALGH